jgi:hypothetical protein
MFLFHSCNHALTPHFHQFTVLGLYVVINLGLFLLNILTTPDDLWFYWVLLAWGIGLAAHAVVVYGSVSVLGVVWEERKIRELMDKK